MISIILYNPSIPPNTGNIMRLCSNTGFKLHLIKPLGFSLDNKGLKRAKMDYFADTNPFIHDSFEERIKILGAENLLVFSKFGKNIYDKANFTSNSVLLFGSETKGLPKKIRDAYKDRLFRIPMIESSRSLNLSNAVSIIVYEAWKNLKFCSFK